MTVDSDTYEVRAGLPDVETFRRLRTGAGMADRPAGAVAAGLPNSWHGVLVRHRGRVVGMGRVIGDGGCAFQIADVCLLPEHQGRGLGRRIMGELVAELERRAPAGAYVSLIADGDARHLYEKYGFTETAPHSVGMHRLV